MNSHIPSSTHIGLWDTDSNVPAESPSCQFAEISEEAIADLFSKMQALYGAKFLEQWKDIDINDMRRHWRSAFERMTIEQMQRGTLLLETLDLPPTLPQFIKLCKPALDPQAAYFEAIAGIAAREHGDIGEWSDPAIYWATTAIGAFDLKTLPYRQIRRRWITALADAQAAHHTEPIPTPERRVPILEDEPEADAGYQHATKTVAAEKAIEVARSTNTRPDHKRWAKRIEERIARGDKTVTKTQARAAREALREKH